MSRIYLSAIMGALLAACPMMRVCEAATLDTHVLINFDGTLSGGVYSLGLGEVDDSFTFAGSGAASVAGGIGDVPGDVDIVSGFLFDATELELNEGFQMRTTSWVSEALFKPDADEPGQPASNDGNHILGARGDSFMRYNNNDVGVNIGYWDGGSEPQAGVPVPTVGTYNHIALVWDASTNTLSGYVNGTVASVSTGNPFEIPSPFVDYGFFGRPTFAGRAVDGSFDALAFSSFTGTFAPTDFVLEAIPEPGSATLVGLAAVGLGFCLVRRNRG